MTKIPIITQNFSSPDVFSDTPLMLLPQAPPPLPDKDQEGFNQLLLHDLHRHRQSYLRSYTAFETLKKRQDFVLRQENLRSLQNFEQRVTTKQDQFIDQSIHSYEQCFVKVINGHSTTNGNLPDQQRRPKSAAPSFDRFHTHQLSHIVATPLDPPLIVPFQRYQKTHRPASSSKYRAQSNLYRSAQSFHDAFQSSSFINRSQPFLSFTEGYLQKYGDRTGNKFPLNMTKDGMSEIKEKEEEEGDRDQQTRRPASAQPNLNGNQTKKPMSKSKTPDLQHMRTTISSRNTNTPSSTPQLHYNDALRDGLTINKDNEVNGNQTSTIIDKRRSSQQSTSQGSNSDNRTSTKRPKTAKKKSTTNGSNSALDKKAVLTIKTTDNDLLKKAMTVQNYGNNTTELNPSSIIERFPAKKPLISLHQSSVSSNDNGTKSFLDNIDTQMTTTTTTTTATTTIEKIEPIKEQPIIEQNQEQVLMPITNTIVEKQAKFNDQLLDQRKRVKKGAFDASESMNDMVAFELGMIGSRRGATKSNQFHSGKENKHQNDDGTEAIPENQATLDLLERIRQSSTGLAVGNMPVSQQGCRFELPFDLKLLEILTPLEYLSKYCRLSSRRNYQFKRIFDKYRNNQYRFESNNLYTAIIEIHSENFTRSQYDYLCQMIDIGVEQHQFTFNTFAGILALCERILYDSSKFRSGFDEHDLAKDTIEKCDFDSLDRKFDGLMISETMKKLLTTL